MKHSTSRLFLDMILIATLATAVGLVWNNRLLRDAYRGEAVHASQPAASTAPGNTLPLPLGLMQVKDLLDRKEAVIVDARDRSTFAKGHIRGALSLPLGEVDSLLVDFGSRINKDQFLIIYCNGFGCHDSMTLGERLIQEGFSQVFVYEGGYPEWKDAGYPVDKVMP